MKKLLILLFIAGIGMSGCKKDTPVNNLLVNNIDINKYKPVQINDQIWTTLNYDGPEGTLVLPSGFSQGYNLKPAVIERLYGFDDLATIKSKLTDGWRIPTKDDLLKLANNLSGNNYDWIPTGGISKERLFNGSGLNYGLPLLEEGYWNGVIGSIPNSTGFNALPILYKSYPKVTGFYDGSKKYTFYLGDSDNGTDLTFMGFSNMTYQPNYDKNKHNDMNITLYNNVNILDHFSSDFINSTNIPTFEESLKTGKIFSIRFVKDK